MLTERLRLGYYARYDNKASEFIRNIGALRIRAHAIAVFGYRLYRDDQPRSQQVLLVINSGDLGLSGQKMSYAAATPIS